MVPARFAREPIGNLYCTDERTEADFDDAGPAAAEQDIATFRQEVGCAGPRSRPALDESSTAAAAARTSACAGSTLHMIEEYARHNGHADLIRRAHRRRRRRLTRQY